MKRQTRGRPRKTTDSDLVQGVRSGGRQQNGNHDVDFYDVGRSIGKSIVSQIRKDELQLPVTFTVISAGDNGIVVGQLEDLDHDVVVTHVQEPLTGEIHGMIVDSRGVKAQLLIGRTITGEPKKLAKAV